MMSIEGIYLHQPGERRQPTAQLIGDFMPSTGAGLLIGDSGIGKTFTALAMASALATGKPFFDRWPIAERNGCDRSSRNECGATLFVLSEGQAFFPRRMDAAYHALEPDDQARLVNQGFSGLPVFQMDGSNWHEAEAYSESKERIVTLSNRLSDMAGNVSLDLIVIDTVSGVFMAPAENDAAITQRTMNNISKLSREAGAFVLGITHPAKGKAKSEPRGSIVFGATADLKITAEYIGRSRARTGIYIPKSREGARHMERTEYALVGVSLPDGQSSMVARAVRNGDSVERELETAGRRFSKYEKTVLEAYEIAAISEPTRWLEFNGNHYEVLPKESIQRLSNAAVIDDGVAPGTARRSVNRAIVRLVADGYLEALNNGSGEYIVCPKS
ncbi:AAA family ATPase [bacterium SCSIO 12827]|nr:AAA family ATPase [bacterium SCSIO 12827]